MSTEPCHRRDTRAAGATPGAAPFGERDRGPAFSERVLYACSLQARCRCGQVEHKHPVSLQRGLPVILQRYILDGKII
jgi:hypothetical protein